MYKMRYIWCCRVYEGAANNLPDESSERTSRKILEIVESAGENELVIALVSGGGSALLSLPCEGVSIQEKRKVYNCHYKMLFYINVSDDLHCGYKYHFRLDSNISCLFVIGGKKKLLVIFAY